MEARTLEYGRNVEKMVNNLKTIEDREKRNTQAAAIVKVMELLNPQVRAQENYEQKLWDSLYIIAGFDLDIDSPYPCPSKEAFETKPLPIPMKGSKIRATHYGRNIEKILDLLATEEDSPEKTEMIRNLAIYMRQQYLIWNKDSVSDETIFADIEKFSEGRVTVPEGVSLGRVSENADFSRPGIGNQSGVKNNRHRGRRNKRR